MKTDESLYTRILLWIFEKQFTGFSNADLKGEFNLSQAQEDWVQNVFRPASTEERLFNPISTASDIQNPLGSKNQSQMFITGKGIAAAIDYIDLKEARESSSQAKKLALISMGIAVVLSFIQII